MYKKTIFLNVEASNHGTCVFKKTEISETELKKILKSIDWDTIFMTDENGESYRIGKW